MIRLSAVLKTAPRSRVLVVDDDPEIVTFLATLLELEGIESQVATSAAAALSLLDRGLPSLVLLDIAMPDRDGLDLCRALKKDPRLEQIKGYVEDSGEGRWTVQAAIDQNVPAPVITLALQMRIASRQEESFGAKVQAALRNEFGGHAVKKG